MVSYDYLQLSKPKYDYVVIDEIQDLTVVQIELILASLKSKEQFLFSGDSNQIVHPNFFSWAKIKSLLYQKESEANDILCLLSTNYRNSKSVVGIANNVLKIKQQRFGSIDKESNYLVNALTENQGRIFFLTRKSEEIKKLNSLSMRSIKFAIIVDAEKCVKALETLALRVII